MYTQYFVFRSSYFVRDLFFHVTFARALFVGVLFTEKKQLSSGMSGFAPVKTLWTTVPVLDACYFSSRTDGNHTVRCVRCDITVPKAEAAGLWSNAGRLEYIVARALVYQNLHHRLYGFVQ